jgi:multiple sugar transport system permease protein
MMQILASLQTVPEGIREAATIDGANSLQIFWKIILPYLKPTIAVALILDTLWWFKHVTLIWLLTEGGPGISSTTLAVDIYKRAFQYFDFGLASAISVIIFAICAAITVLYKRLLNND